MRYHRKAFKDPDAVQPFTIDWEPFIPYGDTITSATSTAYTGGTRTADTTITVDNTTNTQLTTTTTLSLGVDASDYDITVHINTANSLQLERTILIRCRQQ